MHQNIILEDNLNILLVTDPYPPEIRAISRMMQELAEFLYKKGNSIKVLTTMPQLKLIEKGTEADLPIHRVENGVNVIRAKIPFQNRKELIFKALSQILSVPVLYKTFKLNNSEKIDIIIVYSPPLPLGIIGIILKKLYDSKFLLNIQDIFPQNAIDLGIIKNKYIVYFYELLERVIYKHADKISAHTQGCKEFLNTKKYIDAKKLITISNWIDISRNNAKNKKSSYKEIFSLSNKFVIVSAGIMGPSQNLTLIIDLAERIVDLKEICFLLLGNGYEADKIKDLVKKKNLKNVIINDFIGENDYKLLIREADLGIISLNPNNKTPVYPGKTLGFMAASLPIISFLHENSDGHKLIKDSNCGYTMVPNNSEEAESLLRFIYDNRRNLKKLGNNGYNFCKLHFSKEVILLKYENILHTLINS